MNGDTPTARTATAAGQQGRQRCSFGGVSDDSDKMKENEMGQREPRTMTEQANDHDETGDGIPIRHVQTASIRYEDRGDGKGRYRLTLSPAIRAAGLDAGALFRYIPEEAENLGVVPALGSESGNKNLRDQRTYTVQGEGATGDALRLTIPEAALEALGIDPDAEAAEAGEMPLLDVFAGDRMIAFDKSSAISLPAEVLSDEYAGENASNGEEVILDQIQTTTPLKRINVTAAVSPALRHAGDKTGSVEFRADLADELGGIVPVIPHAERYDGRTQADAHKVYREGEEKETLVIPLPEQVLDALGFSEDDYEDVPREDRPPLAVYAGEGIIAFARPGAREVAVDRAQTPGERAPSLTDIDGIGPALAERLPSAGYETVEDLADATREELLAIDRLGEGRADRIIADVSNRVER